MITDDKTAIASPQEFATLPEYSLSVPTGTTIGKVWKAKERVPAAGERYGWRFGAGWSLGEYVDHADPKLVGIKWRELLVVS